MGQSSSKSKRVVSNEAPQSQPALVPQQVADSITPPARVAVVETPVADDGLTSEPTRVEYVNLSMVSVASPPPSLPPAVTPISIPHTRGRAAATQSRELLPKTAPQESSSQVRKSAQPQGRSSFSSNRRSVGSVHSRPAPRSTSVNSRTSVFDRDDQGRTQDVSKWAHLTAHERVVAAYKLLHQQNMVSGPSACFRSKSPREAFQPTKTEERLPATPPVSRSASQTPRIESKPSAWARSTTPRGDYLYNWGPGKEFPSTVPPRHADPTPGPGSYTSPLFFMGK